GHRLTRFFAFEWYRFTPPPTAGSDLLTITPATGQIIKNSLQIFDIQITAVLIGTRTTRREILRHIVQPAQYNFLTTKRFILPQPFKLIEVIFLILPFIQEARQCINIISGIKTAFSQSRSGYYHLSLSPIYSQADQQIYPVGEGFLVSRP